MEILFIVFLILLNGTFSMSEIALVSARKFKLEMSAEKGNGNAKKALELANNPNTFLSTVQIGITLIGILTGIFSGESITSDLETILNSVPFLEAYSRTLAVVGVVIIVTFFSIVFGELIPKRIGLMFPEKIAMVVSRPMTLFSLIAKPFIWLLTQTNNLFLRIFGLADHKEDFVSEEEIKSIIQDSTDSGEIQQIEQDIVRRVFALGDRRVIELMTHRRDLISFHVNDNLDIVKQKALKEAHSAYPVYSEDAAQPIGIVSVKDIFPHCSENKDFNLKSYLRVPLMVHETTPAYKVLESFRLKRLHYGFVLDEYGTIQGMVTMDDILDALIGDVSEYNQEQYLIVKRDETTWLADGSVPFFEFLSHFNLEQTDDLKGGFNTLAGFVLSLLGDIPKPGQKVKWMMYEFEVLDMDGSKIDKIMITELKA